MSEQIADIKVVGKSWVISLPDDFTSENNLQKDTKVLLTFKNDNVQAEILPPLSKKLKSVADEILHKRHKMFEEIKRIGD